MTRVTLTRFPSLAAARAHYLAQVDAQVGAVRAQHLTVVPGQAETYQAKAADAERYQADPTATCPWVEAEAEALGITPAEAAARILAQRDAWVQLGVTLERLRIAAKAQISALEQERAMAQVVQQLADALAEYMPQNAA